MFLDFGSTRLPTTKLFETFFCNCQRFTHVTELYILVCVACLDGVAAVLQMSVVVTTVEK